MSAFLGPIHHWLFKKIVLFEDLEKNIVVVISNKYNKERVEGIIRRLQQQYGALIPEKPLEELIDTNNIHGWLQNKISIAETRQAATIKEFIDVFGNEVLKVIEDIYEEQGKFIGKEVASTGKINNAIDLYQELNNYLLEGMPCDNVNNVIFSSNQEVKWQITQCLHKPYWDHVGMDSDIMYHLRSIWVKAFVENTHPSYTYTINRDSSNEISLHNIFMK